MWYFPHIQYKSVVGLSEEKSNKKDSLVDDVDNSTEFIHWVKSWNFIQIHFLI